MAQKKHRTGVFISYSHRDQDWLATLRTHLAPYLHGERISLWDDTQIKPGQSWREMILDAMATARVAVLLVSPEFLASPFIASVELPNLLRRTGADLALLWVPIRPSAWEATPLREIQAAWDPSAPLNSLSPAKRDSALVRIAKLIEAAANVNAVGTALGIIDEFEPEVETFLAGQPEPTGAVEHSEYAEQVERRIDLVRGGQRVQLITAEELEKLDPQSLILIRAYERAMKELFERWTELKVKRYAANQEVRREARAESDDVRRDLCTELNGLLSFLESLGKQLHDHYVHVRHICTQPAAFMG